MKIGSRIWSFTQALPGTRPGGIGFDDRFQTQGLAWGQVFGWPAQLALALLWFAGAAGPIGAVEILPVPLVACALLRLHATGWMAPRVLTSRLVAFWLLFCGWFALTLLWSPQPGKGFQELANARWLWCLAGVVPVLHRRSWLIGALVGGVLLGNAFQALEAIGLRTGADWLVWPHPPNPLPHARISGWWHHPVMGGIILVGALGLHLPPAVFGQGWRRAAGIAGCLVSVAGMVATGSRGPWLASAALIALTLLVALVRMPRARAFKIGAAACMLALVFGGAAWVWRGDAVQARIDSAMTELSRAVNARDYASDSGARIQFAIWATEMISERPLLGHGAGAYEAWTRESVAASGADATRVRFAPQAHNTLLHAWATLGLPGVVLLMGVMAVAVGGGLVAARISAPVGHDWLGTYGAGPAWALIGVSLVSLFDTIYVNIQPAAFTTALMCLCLPVVPRVAKTEVPEGR